MNSLTHTFSDACILKTTASTNGYFGGDSGHGSKTEIVFEDLGSTDFSSESDRGKVTIRLGGDSELQAIIESMRFAANALEKLAGKKSSSFSQKGVWVHAQGEDGTYESEGLHQFLRVPCVGEEICITSGGPHYKVVKVVHAPFAESDSDVEIFADIAQTKFDMKVY